MKTLAFIFIINAVEVMVENITPVKPSTSSLVTCPKDCDKPRLLDRNCLSCYKVDSNDTQDEMVSIAADHQANIDSPEDSVIDDVVVDGNESLFSAFIIMKNNKDSEEIILDSNEVKNIETVLPHDNTKLKRVVTQGGDTDSVNVDDITGNRDKIDSPDVLLRKRPWKGCLKKAAKMCKKACKTAVKDACDYHDCKKKLKRGLKKECKRSCNRQFLEDY